MAVACSFKVYAVVDKREDHVRITSTDLNHACIGVRQASRPAASFIRFLSKELPKLITITRKTSTADIKDIVLGNFSTAISLQQCRRLKMQLTLSNRAHQLESFEPIPSYIERLKAANPGVHAELVQDEEQRFQRVFIAPQTSKAVIGVGPRFLALDATYLRDGLKQCFLIAVKPDSNNEVMLLACAVVESERADSWRWFIPTMNEKSHNPFARRWPPVQARIALDRSHQRSEQRSAQSRRPLPRHDTCPLCLASSPQP